MNISSKEEYLENLKNKMLFHFSHQDIFATLEDISLGYSLYRGVFFAVHQR